MKKNKILNFVLWNNNTPLYDFTLSNMILYSVLWNNVASFDFILRSILYSGRWNNIAPNDFILLNIISCCMFFLRCNMKSYTTGNNASQYQVIRQTIASTSRNMKLWFQMTECCFIGRSMKLYVTTWNHKRQYWIKRQNAISKNAVWDHIAQYKTIKGNIKGTKYQIVLHNMLKLLDATSNHETPFYLTRRNRRSYCAI